MKREDFFHIISEDYHTLTKKNKEKNYRLMYLVNTLSKLFIKISNI